MLIKKIKTALKEAMKNKDTQTVSVLRMLISALNNEAISLKKKDEGLNEEEELKVLRREIKKRKNAVQQYEFGGRPELAEKEKQELEIIQKYLPEQMSEDEIKRAIQEVIDEIGEVLPNQFGQVMGKVMNKLKGKADGSIVSRMVKEMIG